MTSTYNSVTSLSTQQSERNEINYNQIIPLNLQLEIPSNHSSLSFLPIELMN